MTRAKKVALMKNHLFRARRPREEIFEWPDFQSWFPELLIAHTNPFLRSFCQKLAQLPPEDINFPKMNAYLCISIYLIVSDAHIHEICFLVLHLDL